MIDPALLLWMTLMFLGFAGSALYSGLETGAYRINRVRLEIRAHENDRRAQSLQKLLRHPTSLLTTLLIGNNIANYLGTAGLAVILENAGISEAKTIVLNALIVTPILFVFGETLPKDLFSVHADQLMYRFSPVLNGSRRLFYWTGLLGLVTLFSNRLIRVLGSDQDDIASLHPRRRMTDLVGEAVGEGIISDEQSSMVHRVLMLGHTTLADEMTPWRSVHKVPIDAPVELLRQRIDTTGRTRFVVMEGKAVVGSIDAVSLLLAAQKSPVNVRDWVTPMPRYAIDTPLRDALANMQTTRAAIALVTRHDKPVGIVTFKDLVEPLTGELTTW